MANRTAPCSVCCKPTEIMRHEFRIGSLPNHHRGPDWTIVAPLYFAAAADKRSAVAFFCSAECGLKWREAA